MVSAQPNNRLPTRALVVEDCRVDAALLRSCLEKNRSVAFQMVHVETLSEALQDLASNDSEVILLDLSLPDSHGLKTLEKVLAFAPNVPVVVLTGLADEDLAVHAVQAGAQDYLLKGELSCALVVRALRYAIERKRVQAQLQEAHKMESVGRLAGGVAHDFNNLMMIVSGYSQTLLREKRVDDASRRWLEAIDQAARRATALTRQLLAVGRQQMFASSVFDLNQMLLDSREILQHAIRENIQLDIRLDPKPQPILADRTQIERIVLNLVANARDAMPCGGKLVLQTSTMSLSEDPGMVGSDFVPGDYVALSVEDTGHGMDSRTLRNIFEPFFTTKEVGQGTGLGLATVYGTVKQSGGSVRVQSTVAQGTCFTIFLPRNQVACSPEGLSDVTAPARGTETILLVEDNEAARIAVRELLELQGYSVVDAADGASALLVARKQEGIHLLVTDMVLPDMNGRELADQLDEYRPGLRVIYMSGYEPNLLLPQQPREGEVFLTKPCTLDVLSGAIRSVIESRQTVLAQ